MKTLSKSLCFLVGAALAAGAQPPQTAPDSARRFGWASAFTLGLPGVGSEASPVTTTIGWQLTQLNPGKLSADFAIGTLPFGFTEGVLLVGMRGGLVLPMQAAPDLYLLPSAGVSSIGLIGAIGPGAAGIFGTNMGFGILSGTPEAGAVRFNFTWHRFGDEIEESIWLAEVGFIFKRPQRRR